MKIERERNLQLKTIPKLKLFHQQQHLGMVHKRVLFSVYCVHGQFMVMSDLLIRKFNLHLTDVKSRLFLIRLLSFTQKSYTPFACKADNPSLDISASISLYSKRFIITIQLMLMVKRMGWQMLEEVVNSSEKNLHICDTFQNFVIHRSRPTRDLCSSNTTRRRRRRRRVTNWVEYVTKREVMTQPTKTTTC